jgi:hypothetical protein
MVIGKKGSGNTVLVKDLLRYVPSSHLYIFDPANKYISVEGSKEVKEVVNNDVLGDVIERQSAGDAPVAQIVIDNALCDQPLCSMANFKHIVANNEQNKLGLILTLPASILPPSVNSNVDIVFIFKETNEAAAKRIYENHGTKAFPAFADFWAALSKLDQFASLVIEDGVRASVYTAQV